MTKFVVVYDKTTDFTSLESNLVSAGCTILKHLSGLNVLVIECLDTSFETIPGVLAFETENEIIVTEQWHLNRITCKSLPMKLLYLPKNLGSGASVYLIDSGVDATHPEFPDANIQHLWSWDNDTTDVNGHGTSMASLIVGSSLGVAPEATLKSVKIPFGTTITTSVLLSAFDAILVDHLLTPDVKVVNCSWTVPKSSILDAKITELQSHGLVIVAAAGNDIAEADTLSPVGLDSVIGVAASDAYDRVVAWAPGAGSNWGPEVDITAPGVDVDVAMLGGATETKSGTSLASSIVSGAACQFIVENPGLTAVQIQEAIVNHSTPDILFRNESIYGTTPNVLLHTLSLGDVFLTPVIGDRTISLQRGATIEVPVTYTTPVNSLKIHNISIGNIQRTAPEWVTVTNDVVHIAPPEDLPVGKYRIFIQGLVDDTAIQTFSLLVNIYEISPSELEEISLETYFVSSTDGTEIVVKQTSCSGGCFGNFGGTCTNQSKGCNCSNTSSAGTCLQS